MFNKYYRLRVVKIIDGENLELNSEEKYLNSLNSFVTRSKNGLVCFPTFTIGTKERATLYSCYNVSFIIKYVGIFFNILLEKEPVSKKELREIQEALKTIKP